MHACHTAASVVTFVSYLLLAALVMLLSSVIAGNADVETRNCVVRATGAQPFSCCRRQCYANDGQLILYQLECDRVDGDNARAKNCSTITFLIKSNANSAADKGVWASTYDWFIYNVKVFASWAAGRFYTIMLPRITSLP